MSPLFVTTPTLDIAYETGGPDEGPAVLLLHGWPDDVRTYDRIKLSLHDEGFRTFAPWLRGFGETRFRSAATPRSGQIAAMAQDALDFADALALDRFHIVGHDWGSRIAYFLASLYPNRLVRMVTMSLGWDPGPLKTPSLEQAQRFWYQWFMTTARGQQAIRADGIGFARFQWHTWSPPGWFDEAAFVDTARAFENPDWIDITLHSYQVRWGEADPDPQYAAIEERQRSVRSIGVPTLLIHGGDDRCVGVTTSEGKERHFSEEYERHVLPGIGHFPTREAPDEVAQRIVAFFSR